MESLSKTRWWFGTPETHPAECLAAAAAEQEAYRPELIADEEPRYLRRQKPVEIRRKKFGGKTWPFYRRVFFWTVVGAAARDWRRVGGALCALLAADAAAQAGPDRSRREPHRAARRDAEAFRARP